MHIRVAIIFCCIAIYSINAQQYILQIQSLHNEGTPQLRAYYKGNRLHLTDASFCRLPESRTVSDFAVIVADDIQFEWGKRGVVNYIQRPHERSLRWFDLTYHNEDLHTPWHVCERSHDDIPARVPENTIYILTNPDYIENVSLQQIKGAVCITLEYNEHNNPDKDDKATHAIMASLDAQAFHTDVPQHVVHQDRSRYVTTSMLYNTL